MIKRFRGKIIVKTMETDKSNVKGKIKGKVMAVKKVKAM